MRLLFVDTAAWVAAADARDTAGPAVRETRDLWLSQGGMLVTSDYVVDETLTPMRFRLGLDAAEAWWLQIDNSSQLQIESIVGARSARALLLFFRYRDKDSSLTDCSSFVGMHELNISHALTLDHHFRQMGFEVVP